MADDEGLVDAELDALRQDGGLQRLGFGFLRLPGGELAAVHARYTPARGLRAGSAKELRRTIIRSLEASAAQDAANPLQRSPAAASEYLGRVPLVARDAFVLTLVRQHPRTRHGEAVVCQRCQQPIEWCDVNRARASHLDSHMQTTMREER